MLDYAYGCEVEYSIVNLSSVSTNLIEDFDCGIDEINKVFKNNPENDFTCKVFIDNINNRIIGFIAYRSSGIRMTYEKDIVTKSALEISYFALDNDYQHLPYNKDYDSYNLSDSILCECLKMFRNLSEEVLYFSYIVLFSVPSAINFYKRNFFEEFNQYMESDNYTFIDGCIPMFMAL